jgi:Uma2 family endonuclease
MAIRPDTVLTPEVMVANGIGAEGENLLKSNVSEALYWDRYYNHSDINYEWNNGQVEATPMTDYAKYMMYLWFLDLLRDFLYAQSIARIIGLELGFRLALPTKTTIRKPDLDLVLNSNPIPLGDHDRSYRGIFDLCVESLADGSQLEIERDTIVKRDEYATAGVQEYYILDERGLETQFYQLTRRGVYQPMPRIDGVVRSQILPGFQFRVQDLYRKPPETQMVGDPLYQAFVSPLYRAERLRAEQAETRAEQYAAILKAAGLLPPDEQL